MAHEDIFTGLLKAERREDLSYATLAKVRSRLSDWPMRGHLNALTQRTSLVLILATMLVVEACQSPQSPIARETSASPPQPLNCAPMLFRSSTVAKYPTNAKPGFNSPEEVTAFLEKRWPLADIRKYAIPERRHNDHYQNLVPDTSEIWAGRLYCDKTTGFDSIEWYATTETGHTKEPSLNEYSLGAIRGKDFWLLEIGSPTSAQQPPSIEPDFREPYFVGHK
ncbi:MAG TPA: hypothetical protein VKP58_15805 [Candidatus Acidoferrum sp.]|nr:hypothetical protein [Candidatus Acidoferrum sp.]